MKAGTSVPTELLFLVNAVSVREIQAMPGVGGQSLGSWAIPVTHRSYYLPALFAMTEFGLNSAVGNEDWNKTLTESKMWNSVDCQAKFES